MQSSKESKGFTLIELLVVVGIIGLLSSVVLVAVFSGRSRARDGRRKADIKQIQGALELYANANGGIYPLATDGTAVPISNSASPSCVANASFSTAVVPTYLPVLPQTQPGVSTCYVYFRSAGGVAYKIEVEMENSGDSDALNDGGNRVNWFEVFGGAGSQAFNP
jgi:prepilin-type N-terminal cleavage/methylation domain-containing protein